MNLTQEISSHQNSKIGDDIHRLMTELYPICRSITGNGVRKTLDILKKFIPLEIYEVPSGTPVFDWTVPKEWNIRDAYIKNSKGERIVDFNKCNLHVLNYSIPVHKKITLQELKPHLYSIPEHPEWIPYRTSYYNETWGFCISHQQLQALDEDEYEVMIDATLADGNLTYGEFFLEGACKDEVLLATHVCHPSLCNDNLAGVSLSTFMANKLAESKLNYSYKFLFMPGTIGSITWLALNEKNVGRIKHGLILACLGDKGNFTYKKSRQGDAEIDRIVDHSLKYSDRENRLIDFFPYGYDERQFCSPGFNLPVGCLMRTPHGEFPEYHTSADNFDLVKPENLTESFHKLLEIIFIIENNRRYINLNPKCEPQLGKRGLYANIGGENSKTKQMAMLWVLNLSDGKHTLLDIAERADIKFDLIRETADILIEHDLLKESAD